MKVIKKNKIIGFILILISVLALPLVFQTTPNVIFADGTDNGLSVNVTNSINGVLGKTKTVTVTMKNENKGDNDWIYNVGLKVELDDGLEFVKGDIDLNSKSFKLMDESDSTKGQKQILEWVDITDLAPGEIYSFYFEVRILESYRGTVQKIEDEEGNEIDTEYEIDVDFGDEVGGNITVNGSNDAQSFGGIETSDDFSFKVVPFEVILNGGGKWLKGAGEDTTTTGDMYLKDITIQIINNTKYAVIVEELINTIANGVQVTDLKFGDNEIKYSEYESGLYSQSVKGNEDFKDWKIKTSLSALQWKDVEIEAGGTAKIKYKAAIFDKYTTEDGVNKGTIIEDNTSLPISLGYKGCIKPKNGDEQNGEDKGECEGKESISLIAKDIIINKTNTYDKPIQHNSVFTYKIEAKVNQYHDISDIVITDTLGDGQEFVKDNDKESYTHGYKITNPTEGLTVAQAVYDDQPNGETKIIWTIDENFIASETYSLEFQAKVKEKWHDNKPIVAGDGFANKVEIAGTNIDTEKELDAEDSTSVSTPIPLPKIEKKIIDINGDTNPDSFKDDSGRYRVNIGDVIKFEVKYKADDIGVQQKGVEITDIFPQGTVVDTDEITYSANWPEGVIPEVTTSNPNILRWKFDSLPADINELTVQYKVTVENEPENKDAKQTFNLAKMSVKNTRDRVQSERAQVELTYTEPILEIKKEADKTANLVGGDEVTFTITVTNTGMGTAYGVKMTDLLPTELKYNSLISSDEDVTKSDGENNTVIFTLTNAIESGAIAEIKYTATVIDGVGSGKSFTNTATIDEYKNRNDTGDTRTYNKDLEDYTPPSSSTTMNVKKSEISMVVVGDKDNYKVGDEVIYKVEVKIPDKTTAYNGYVDVAIDNNQEIQGVYKDNINGTEVSYKNSEKKELWNTDASATGTLTYYVKTEIKETTTIGTGESQKGKAIFHWYDENSTNENNKHNTDEAQDNVTIKWPQLSTTIEAKNKDNGDTICQGESVTVTFTVTNTGENTAYNFIPTIEVPAGFTISGLEDISGAGSGTSIELSSENYTGFDASRGGTITLPKVSSLDPNKSKKYEFTATLVELQCAGSSKQFYGDSGEYWTNTNIDGTTGAGYKLDSIPCSTEVTIPRVIIEQQIIATSNEEDTENKYIRPGDTVDYKITVTVPQGTIAYDLNIVDMLPADFEVVKDENEQYKTIIDIALDAEASDISVVDRVATIELGKTVDASTAKQVIVKIIRLKAKTDKSYGETKTETNIVKAEWQKEPNNTGTPLKTEEKKVDTDVREPNLSSHLITIMDRWNNLSGEDVVKITAKVENNRETPAYNGEFTLNIPEGFEVVSDTISDSGTLANDVITWTKITVPAKNSNGNGKKEFTVDLKLKEDGSAGAGSLETITLTVKSYESLDSDTVDGGLTAKKYNTGPAYPTDNKSLSIAPITIEKTVKSTTLNPNDYNKDNHYVRPGDTITYEIKITVPKNTTAYDVKLKDSLGGEQELVSIKNWKYEDITLVDGAYILGNLKYEEDAITDGIYTITVVSKVKTDTSYGTDYNFTNEGEVKWKDAASEGKDKDAKKKVTGKVKQPSLGLNISRNEDISTPKGTSKIIVSLSNTVDTPAYNIKVEVEIPDGLKIVKDKDDNNIISNGGQLSEDGKKIIWNNILEFSNSEIPDISFEVKADGNPQTNENYNIEAKLLRYRTNPTEEGNIDTETDGRVELTNVKKDVDVRLEGRHTLSEADPSEKEGTIGEESQTLTFIHKLTNTGAGKDTYEIITNDDSNEKIYTGKLQYTIGGETKTFTHDEIGNWIGGTTPSITLNAGDFINLTYEITIPIEAPKKDSKTHTITATSTSDSNQKESQQDKVTVIGIDYNGTVFDGITVPTGGDWQSGWEEKTFGPGQKIKLTALTSHDITSVTAKIRNPNNGYVLDKDNQIIVIKLEEISGDKGKWQTDYQLPSGLSAGRYFVEYESFNSNAGSNPQDEDKMQTEVIGDIGYNNYFKIDNPNLSISLKPKKEANSDKDVIVVSEEEVTFTLTVDNKTGKTDAFYVIPKVTIPEGVELITNSYKFIDETVVGAVYGNYSEDVLEFRINDEPFNIAKGEEVKIEFKVKTNDNLSADELLNFPATTGPYYTAIKEDGSPTGAEKGEETASALLKTESITFTKKIKITTNNGKDFVRPGDRIVYEVEIGIPTGLSIYELKLEDIVNDPNDTLIIEKVVKIVNGNEVTIGSIDNNKWTGDFDGQEENLKILVYARVKDEIDNDTFTTKSTANLTWKSKYTKENGENKKHTEKKAIEIPGKRPILKLDSFDSDKVNFTSPNEEITFTAKVKNIGSGMAYDTKLVAKLPEGVVPINNSYDDGEYDSENNTIIWTVDIDTEKEVTFKVKADGDRTVESESKVEFELAEYYSTDNENYTARYEGDSKDITLNSTGAHALGNKHDKETMAGNTIELEHTLTNTGGGKDTFTITVDTDLPIKLYKGDELIGENLDGGSPWTDGTVTITLQPGEKVDLKIEVIIPEDTSKNKGEESHNITLKAKSENSEEKIQAAQNTIKVIGEDLDGWVSNALWSKWEKDKYREDWKEETYYIGQPIKLSAITSIDFDIVKARIWRLDSSGNKEEDLKEIDLSLHKNGELEYWVDKVGSNYKLWDNTDKVGKQIIDITESGRYFIEFIASKSNGSTETEEDKATTDVITDLGYNNYFTVKANITLKGTIKLKDPQPDDTVDGAEVRLVDLTGKPVLNPKTGEEYKTTVGSNGEYEFINVPINQYTLEVVPKTEKYKKYSKAIDVKPEPGKDEVVIDVELVGFSIDLKANPSTIVGDGDSRTILTTKVICKDGLPVGGAEVKFKDLLAGKILGEAKDPKDPDGGHYDLPSDGKYITNEKGEVYIVYESEKIEGIVSQVIPVAVEVICIEKGIYGEDSIFITFEPASIKGIVKDNNTDEPIEGARVIVTSADGSFSAEQITGKDGKYKIAIPKEGDYDIEITKPVKIGDETHDISFKQKANVAVVTGVESDPIPSDKTFTGILIMADKNGVESLVKSVKDDNDIEKEIKIKQTGGGSLEGKVDKDTGIFSIEGLAKDTEYEFLVTTEVNGKELLMGKIKVKITEDGEINIHEELIDPYGTITDKNTGKVLGNVYVELYYADTARNTTNGKAVNKPVPQSELGGIFTFPPNDNKNPQWSTATLVYNNDPLVKDHGNYAWMVPANADYYIIATKSGYMTYDSKKDSSLSNVEKGNYYIKVDTDIVKYDFAMTPISSSGGGGKGGGPLVPTVPKKPEEPVDSDVSVKPDLPESGSVAKDTTIESSGDKRSYLEEKEGEISIKYYIKEEPGKDMEIVFYIPKGAIVKDTDGGTVVGDKIVWKVDDSDIGKIAEKKLKIILPKITKIEETMKTISELKVDGEAVDTSVLEILIFSNRYGNGEHPRYIQGIPGGDFNPASNITRAEVAVIFSRILKLESLVKYEKMYDDVDIDAWHARGIEAATKKGLFQGIGNNMFKPNQPITRGELAAVIARYLNLPDKKPIQLPFKDIDSNWAFTYITELYRNNIITGYQDGSFKPGSQLRRDEAVTMINRMLNRGPLKNVEPTYPDMPKDNWAFGDVEECSRTHRYYRNEDSSETHVETIDEDLFF